MRVDDGFTQTLEMVCGTATARPIVPVFINCAAEVFDPVARVRLLGRWWAAPSRANRRSHIDGGAVVGIGDDGWPRKVLIRQGGPARSSRRNRP